MKTKAYTIGRTTVAFVPYERPWYWRKLVAAIEFEDGMQGRGWAFGPLMFIRRLK